MASVWWWLQDSHPNSEPCPEFQHLLSICLFNISRWGPQSILDITCPNSNVWFPLSSFPTSINGFILDTQAQDLDSSLTPPSLTSCPVWDALGSSFRICSVSDQLLPFLIQTSTFLPSYFLKGLLPFTCSQWQPQWSLETWVCQTVPLFWAQNSLMTPMWQVLLWPIRPAPELFNRNLSHIWNLEFF